MKHRSDKALSFVLDFRLSVSGQWLQPGPAGESQRIGSVFNPCLIRGSY